VLLGIKDQAKRRQVLETPTCPIAQAPGGGLVEIQGRVVPSEQGSFVAPLSGRHCVHLRVTAHENSKNGAKRLDLTLDREFWVDDGSGHYARVRPSGARFCLERDLWFEGASARLNAFLLHHGLKGSSSLGTGRELRCGEETLCVGDRVYALGPSMRQPSGRAAQGGGRAEQATVLWVYAAHGPGGQLIVTNKPESELAEELGSGVVSGVVIASIGGLAAVAAMIGFWIEQLP
jgi:hypothetical protein